MSTAVLHFEIEAKKEWHFEEMALMIIINSQLFIGYCHHYYGHLRDIFILPTVFSWWSARSVSACHVSQLITINNDGIDLRRVAVEVPLSRAHVRLASSPPSQTTQ